MYEVNTYNIKLTLNFNHLSVWFGALNAFTLLYNCHQHPSPELFLFSK